MLILTVNLFLVAPAYSYPLRLKILVASVVGREDVQLHRIRLVRI